MDRIALSLSSELLISIDAARGDIPRSAWIRRACEQTLADPASSGATEPGPPKAPRTVAEWLLSPSRCNRGICRGAIHPIRGRCMVCNQKPL